MILYGSTMSPFVRKALAFAHEKAIELELKQLPIQSPDPDFRKVSPFGKMPALADGDFGVADSSAIVAYFDALKPEPALVPVDPKARATTIWFEEFADTILCEAVLTMFFNRIVSPRFMKQPGNETAAMQAEREKLPPVLAYIERSLPESGHLVEDRLTLADIAVACPLVNLDHLGIAIDPALYPRTRAFAERMHARASFAPYIAKEKAFFARG